MLTGLQKKQLSIDYSIAQPDGRTPLDEINASNETVSGYQSCHFFKQQANQHFKNHLCLWCQGNS